MKPVCVFCGSSFGSREAYLHSARDLALSLVAGGLDLIYGGGNVGLMGELARCVLQAGGRVTGVIPRALHTRVAHVPLTELYIVENMHQRKAKMFELAGAFIAMPGGIGTLEEFFEVFTWQQLNFHTKPVGLFNVDGFFDHLLALLDHLVAEGFFLQQHRANLLVSDEPVSLLKQLADFSPVAVDKWLDETGLAGQSAGQRYDR